MMQLSKSKPLLLTFLLLVAFSLIVPAAFISLHLATPSDGMRLADRQTIFTPEGVILTPYKPDGSDLQNGDILVAVEGKDMVEWAENLFQSGIPRPQWSHGQTVLYTIQRNGQIKDVNLKLGKFPLGVVLSDYWGAILFAFVSQVIALFVLIRQPNDPAARALFIWAMSGSHTYAWSFFLQVSDIVGGTGFWLFRVATPGFWLVYWAATLHVALVFPKRVRIIQRRPYLIGLLYLTAFSLYFAYLGWARYQSINTLDWLNEWATGESMIAGLYLSLTMVVILYQFRTSREGSERIKIRWAVYGAFISGITGLVFWIIYPAVSGNTILSANVLGLLMLPFPLSLAIAIGRHKLFDIDVIIQRTLVYGVLTTMLAIIYLISVVTLQQIFRSLTGQSSPLAIVASTLLIAGLFYPLRHRVQDIIDQRFYRRKYDAEKTLNAFSKYSQNEVDLIKLSKQLLTVSQLTFQPDNLSLWISQQTKPSNLPNEIIQSHSIERQIPPGDS